MQQKKKSSITLLTYNTLGVPILAPDMWNRTRIIATELEKSDYDVVCLQEVFFHTRLSLFKQWMPSFKYCVYKNTFFGPKGGLVIFSKVPLELDTFIQYARPKKAKSPWYTRLSRNGLLVARFKDIPLALMTTHLTSERIHHLTPQNKYYQLISEQAFTAARTVREYAKKQNDVILAGDFNIAKGTELYNAVVIKARVKDVSGRLATPTYYNDRINAKYNGRSSDRIDHIFISNTNRYTSVTGKLSHIFDEKFVLHSKKESYLSDHIGILCTITVKNV